MLGLTAAALGAELNAFLNLAARGRVERGENILIGGLVLERHTHVILRGVGPTLAQISVNDPLARPRLDRFDDARASSVVNTGRRTANTRTPCGSTRRPTRHDIGVAFLDLPLRPPPKL